VLSLCTLANIEHEIEESDKVSAKVVECQKKIQDAVQKHFQIVKEETVDGTGHFTLFLLLPDFLVTPHVHDEASKTRIAHQLGRLSQDILVGVRIGGATGRGHEVDERFEPGMGAPLDCSVHATHHQPLVQIEFQQGRAQQDLVTLVRADQGASGRGHDVVLLGKGLHVLAHLRSLDLHVLENGRHFAELVSEVGRRVDVHFQGPEERALLYASQELGLRLLLLAATGKVLVEKGLHVFLLVGPLLMVPLTFSDRHHLSSGMLSRYCLFSSVLFSRSRMSFKKSMD